MNKIGLVGLDANKRDIKDYLEWSLLNSVLAVLKNRGNKKDFESVEMIKSFVREYDRAVTKFVEIIEYAKRRKGKG